MESASDSASLILGSFITQLNAVAEYLPGIVAGLLVLVIGWVAARIARRLVIKLGSASNQLLMRAFPSGIFSGARMSSLSVTLLGEFVFWAMLLIAVTVAARVAEIGTLSEWLLRITAYLPNLIAGIAIVVVGYFLSVLIREQINPETRAEEQAGNLVLGQIAQVAVVSIALIVGLDQIGIDVLLLVGLAVAAATGVLVALAVAFAAGAAAHIRNLIGVRAARSNVSVGMTIQIGEISGEVVELSQTVIALDTDSGRTLIPGKVIDESVMTVLSSSATEEESDD